MNKVYRNVWNENTQTWVAASELANSKTKSNTVCELPLVKHVLNIFGLKKIVSLTLTTLALQLQAVSPAYAANLAITGTSNISTNGTGVSYASGSHGSIALAGDDDFCGADKVNGRRNITTGGISAMEEYLRFAQNRSFNGRNPYGTSNGQQVWTGDGTTGGITSGSSGYMGAPTGGDTNKLPVAYGVYSFASGCGSYATGNYSTAFGNNATATAGGAQAFGVAALASGATAVAIGVGAQATNTASLALGSVATSDGAGSVAVGFNSAAQQDNTTALGANAIATVEKAVALGSDSLANTSAGIQGYDPAGTNTDAVNQSATWKSTAAAVSIGNENTKITRQITGLAAGTADTDAVNVAQLKNLASSTSTGLSNLSTAINSNLNGLNNNVANLQKDALQWNGTAYDASHGTANAQRITNVAAGQIGENSTDAINAGQLFSVSTSTAASLSTLSSTLNQAGDLSNVNANITTINSNINGLNNNVANLQKDALQWNGSAYDASHGTANAQRITNVAAGQIGENSTDAINAGQLFSVSTSTAASLSTLSSTLNQAGDLSNVNANISTINSNINGLNNNVANLQKDALQWNGTAYDASHGTANAQRITNVAAGQIGENSTDAINAGQLFSVSTSTAASLSTLSSTLNQAGDLSNVNANITTINSNINGLNNNVANLQKDALQWNGTAYDASHGTANAQRITNVAAGHIGENSTDAINAGQLFSVSTSTAASLSTLSSTLNQAGDLSNVNANISTINSNINGLNNNVANLQKDALQWNGSAYDASHGTANAQRITNVAVGDTGEYSTDAVNGGQLYSLSSSTMSSVNNLSTTFSDNLSTGLSTANSRIDTVAQSTTTLAGNLTTAVNSISTLQKDALQWNGTAYDASHGTANAQRITNVAAGQIGENSTDAINAGQLFSVSTSTAASLSTLSSTLNQAGDLSNVNANITTINSNLNGLNNNVANLQKDALQWNGTAYDASHGTANAQRITNVAVGDTGEYSTDAVNGGQLYSLSSSTVSGLNNLSTTFSSNLSTGLSTANSRIDTVAQSTTTLAGNLTTAINSISTLQKDALQWNGSAYDASHGTANAQRITNVANGTIGENSTDAVNGGQLYSLSSSIMSSVSSTVDNVVNQNKINLDAVNQDIKTAQTALKIAQNDIKTAQDDILTSKKLIEALQKNSVHFDDIIDDTTPGFFGLTRDTTERTISNIANGRVDATSNQAVNGRQLWQVKNDFKQELQNLSDSFDTKLAQNNNGSTAAINAATDKANQALAKADSLSTSTAEALSSVAASLGGNASYNTVTNSFTAPSYNSTTADGTAVTANNVGDALTNLYNGGSKYAKVNSTLSVASASGNNAIAVGGAAVASGNGAVAIGAEAKASVADGVAIGNHASVTQSGGIALGANSVANTAGGIMGYIPANATTQQARAIQATTSTEAAVSVGDASKGVYRQITGVAAGTADTDAVNVAQLKGVNARMENINRYINDVNDRVQHVERRAYSGTALAMALSGAYLPQLNAGEQTVGVGMGSYHGYTAVGVNYKATNNNGKFSWGAGVSTTGHETGFNAGIGYKW
jgi:autotransporter adhesin